MLHVKPESALCDYVDSRVAEVIIGMPLTDSVSGR